jgi:hypothetical protein
MAKKEIKKTVKVEPKPEFKAVVFNEPKSNDKGRCGKCGAEGKTEGNTCPNCLE